MTVRLRAVLESDPSHEAIVTLADILVRRDAAESLALLERILKPMMLDASKLRRRLGRLHRMISIELTSLLDQVKVDDEARQRFVTFSN